MNINYFDALSNLLRNEPLDLQINSFMAAHAIMLSLVGVPGIYFHSLFGSRGWKAGVEQTGRNRTINRQKCELESLQRELADSASLRSRVFARFRQLLNARSSSPAFDPHGTQKILDVHPSVFGIERISADQKTRALCFHNVSAEEITFSTNYASVTDLFTNQSLLASQITLDSYQVLWMAL
jgi:sucrose phosphorylase